MSKLPHITIVTPNFNSADTLEKTIRSVIEQDYPNLEYIIVDGGSTDGSLDIIEAYSSHFSKVIIEPDQSIYEAVAKGFKAGTGEVFAWLNSDDLYEPNALMRVGKHFQVHKKSQVIYFEDTVIKDGWRLPNRPQKYVSTFQLLRGHIIYQDGCFFRRTAYEAVGGISQEWKLAGDYEFWLRLSRKFELELIPGHASCFRIRKGQLSGQWSSYVEEIGKISESFYKSLSTIERILIFLKGAIYKLRNSYLSISRRKVWPIDNEGLDWVPVINPKEKPLNRNLCPICKSPPHRLLFSTPDTRFGDRHVYRLYECGSCSTVYTFPFPDTGTLQQLYEKTYSSSQIIDNVDSPEGYYSPYKLNSLLNLKTLKLLGKTFKILHKPFKIYYDDIVPIFENKNAFILEIGCFEGRVLEWYKHCGYNNLAGTELNSIAAEKARSKGFKVYTGDINQSLLSENTFDAIVLNQVLEHFEDPCKTLENLAGKLVQGGRIYISVPNLNSFWLWSYYGPSWAHWHIPFHAVAFTPHALHYLAKQIGFRVRWMKSSTPIHWAYLSDQLAVRGLGGVASHNIVNLDHSLWEGAKGATIFSWLFLDRFLRGDCLYVCLEKVI